MPAKGKSKVSPVQRRQIAAGVLTGKTHKTIAKETGLAVNTVDQHATDKRTKSLMAELKQVHDKKLREGFGKAVNTILYYTGDQHRRQREEPMVALRASGEMMKLITAGEMKLDVQSSGGGDFTFAELLEAYLVARRAAKPEELEDLDA